MLRNFTHQLRRQSQKFSSQTKDHSRAGSLGICLRGCGYVRSPFGDVIRGRLTIEETVGSACVNLFRTWFWILHNVLFTTLEGVETALGTASPSFRFERAAGMRSHSHLFSLQAAPSAPWLP